MFFHAREALREQLKIFKIFFDVYSTWEYFDKEILIFGGFVEKVKFLVHLMVEIFFGSRSEGPLAQNLVTRLAFQVH